MKTKTETQPIEAVDRPVNGAVSDAARALEQSPNGAHLPKPEASGPEYFANRPLVLGAGPAGLSAAYALKRAGLAPVILEAGDAVCQSWRDHYPGLRLNSTRRLSSLPGLFMDRRFGPWVAKDDLVRYTERYARRFSPEIRFNVRVERVDRSGGGWLVRTNAGDYWSPRVVVALGLNAKSFLPDWPGASDFTGELVHSLYFAGTEQYVGRDVLVVGVGASGTDIAAQLARGGAGRVWIAIRTPPLIFRRHLSTAVMSQVIKEGRRPPRALVDRLGIVIHRMLWGDTSRYGLPNPTEGLATGLEERGHGSTVDRGLVSAIRAGRIQVLPAVEGFTENEVMLANGSYVKPDAVIAATGQKTSLPALVGHLGVLREDGRPLVHGRDTMPGAPGLHFLGYRLPAGQLLDMRFDAPAIARRMARVLA